jgi:hypothetical protein
MKIPVPDEGSAYRLTVAGSISPTKDGKWPLQFKELAALRHYTKNQVSSRHDGLPCIAKVLAGK